MFRASDIQCTYSTKCSYKFQSTIKTLLKDTYIQFKAIQSTSNACTHCLSTAGEKEEENYYSLQNLFLGLKICFICNSHFEMTFSLWSVYASTLAHVHACIYHCGCCQHSYWFVHNMHQFCSLSSFGDNLSWILHNMEKTGWRHTDYSMLKNIIKYFLLFRFHFMVFPKKTHNKTYLSSWSHGQTASLHRNVLLSWHIFLTSLFSSCHSAIALLPKWSFSAVLFILPSPLSDIPQAPSYVLKQIPTRFSF